MNVQHGRDVEIITNNALKACDDKTSTSPETYFLESSLSHTPQFHTKLPSAPEIMRTENVMLECQSEISASENVLNESLSRDPNTISQTTPT